MMEKVSGFIIVWKLRFHTIINAPRGSHCSGMEECRLRDPPQAENPASQDSFLLYRKEEIDLKVHAPSHCVPEPCTGENRDQRDYNNATDGAYDRRPGQSQRK